MSTRNTRKSKYDPEDNKKSADGKSIRVKKTIVYEEDEQGNITIISSGNTDPEEAYRIVSTYSPILHGKATDTIARMNGRQARPNPLNNTASLDKDDVKLLIKNLDTLSGTLGVSTHKLLSTAIAEFTAENHTDGEERSLRQAKVSIPLREYAIKCGCDITEHPTFTPEEAEQEAKRAKRALDNFRRKVKKDLELLYNASVSWKETVRGNERDFAEVRILGGMGLKSGYITLEFTVTMAEYLIQLPLTQYPQALLKLDERNSNSYNIGLKMSEHYSNYNNQIRGTAQLLKVETLLRYTDLPTIETIREQRTSWEARIKEPLEKALDILTECGLLEDWRYSLKKGAELSDDQLEELTNYRTWAEKLIWFKLRNAPDLIKKLPDKNAGKTPKKGKKSKD